MSDEREIKAMDREIDRYEAELTKLRSQLAAARGATMSAVSQMSEAAHKAGTLEGELKAIGWNGGVAATVDAFRAENERLRAENERLRAENERLRASGSAAK